MISQRSYKKLVSMLVGHESEEPPKQKRSVCCAALRTVVDVKVLMLTMTIWTAIIAVVMLFGMLSGPPDPYSELSLLKKTTEADEAFVKNVNKLLLEWAENRYIYGNQLLSKDMRKIVERGSQMTEERIKLAYKYVREAVSNNRTERAIMDTVELYVRVLGHERTVEVARFLATFIGSDGRDGAGLLVQIETLYAAEMGELIRETLPSTKLGERAGGYSWLLDF
uniref:DUF148 domain-containing protein n=1 Tax=Steinernema glaseri TaxID=37863 RepID=A0A1I7YMC0_9BILA